MKKERESKVEEVTWTCCTYLTGGICSSEALLPRFLVLLTLLEESLRNFYLLKTPSNQTSQPHGQQFRLDVHKT